MTTRPLPIFINRNGGTARSRASTIERELQDAFAGAGLGIDLRLIDGQDIPAAVGEAAKDGMVAVGGGDGTIGSAAGAMVATGLDSPLAILPLGTRNHLARELGLPMDIGKVARIIADGPQRAIDLGAVNDHIFVNNASVGFYPEMVRRREAEQKMRKLPKWLANAPAAWAVLKRARHHRLKLHLAGCEQQVRTPLLFVGNNRYGLEPGKLGKRENLEGGLLSIYALERTTSLGMMGFALRTLIGRADPDRDFAALGDAESLEVAVHAGAIDVAIDGEVVRLTSPLRFEVRPKSLTVIAPPVLE